MGKASLLLAFFVYSGDVLTPTRDVAPDRDPSGAWVLNPALSDLDGLETVGADLLPGGAVEIIRQCLDTSEHLLLRLTDATVTFYSSDGSRRVYPTSGARVREELRDLIVETSAAWTGSALRLNRKTTGVTITEWYAVDPETNRLTVTAAVRAGRISMARRVRRVYESIVPR